MAFLGSVVAIGLGKSIWGGLGHNLFNPALVGRAFLQAAFPSALTTWAPPIQHGEFWALYSSNLALPFMKASSISLPIIKADAISTATPLAQIKFQSIATPLSSLISGNISGSLGETSGFLILLGGLYLLLRRTFDWRIPVSLMLTILTFSSVLYLIGPTRFPSPLFMLFSGGLLFGAIYMATDPVTSPLSPKGAWIFGIGIGILVVLIRLFGGLPEGVMYAILLMNAATPLIDRYTQPRPFGRGEFS
jgi:electron transport complex protein RnfD